VTEYVRWATSYSIFRPDSGGESATAIATGVTGATYPDTGLTNGTKYYYTVEAVNAAGQCLPMRQAPLLSLRLR